MDEVKQSAADALIAAGVVSFSFDAPRTFKSGILAPVYLDNRKLLMHPEAWHIVLGALSETIQTLWVAEPVIAGIEAAGIPHSAALAYILNAPTVFVRKLPKDHGLRQRVEGGDVSGRNVILIEDQITTGGSSLSGVEALREAGAVVDHCLAITSYGFTEAAEAFAAIDVSLHVLIEFGDLLDRVKEQGALDEVQMKELERWRANPQGWTPVQG